MKPENVFLVEAPDGGAPDVKVLDFGIAKLTASDGDVAETAALTGTGALLGTPAYMAPEQAYGEKDLDGRVDVWSLGIILYQCLTGRLPTMAENLGQILKIITQGRIPPIREGAPDLPEDLAALVMSMLKVDRDARPANVRELRSVLERHASGAIDTGDAAPARAVMTASSDFVSGETVLAPSSDVARAPVSDSQTLDPHDVPEPAPPRSRARAIAMTTAVAAFAIAGVVTWRALVRSSAPAQAPAATSSAIASAATSASPPPSDPAPPAEATAAPAASSAQVRAPPRPAQRPSSVAPPPSAPAPSVRVQRDF